MGTRWKPHTSTGRSFPMLRSGWCAWLLMPLLAVKALQPPPLPFPNLNVARMPDPRRGAAPGAAVSVIGFYGSHHNQIGPSAVDSACNATFLGNWWTPAPLRSFAPPTHASDPHSFVCSEAVYWAVQWWSPHAHSFERLNGQQAFELALKLINSSVPQDPYLVEHQEGYDSDRSWSDFCDGTGSNWLGLTLMRVRDELRMNSWPLQSSNWTAFGDAAYSPVDGTPLAGQAAWLKAVQTAATALNPALPYTCPPRMDKH